MSGSTIKHAPSALRSRCGTSQQIRRDCVVDVGKVAASFAVAINCRLIPAQHLHNEFGEHTGVWRRRILPRSENIEIAKTYGFQAVAAVERNHVKLASQFGYRVRRN